MNRIRLFRHELESMPEYSTTMPTGQVDWKMWRAREIVEVLAHQGWPQPVFGDRWLVRQYIPVPGRPDRIGCRKFMVDLLEGPEPPGYVPPDWSNFKRWERERQRRKAG